MFQRAAALADTLKQLRFQVQNSLVQPAATGLIAGNTGVCAAGRLLHTIDEAADDCASTGRASAASSVAPRHASSDEDSQDGVGAAGRGRLSGGLRLSSMGLVKGIGVPLPRQASPDTSAAGSAIISAGPDLSSLPPRLQKLAQVRCRLACCGRFILVPYSFGALHKMYCQLWLASASPAFT